MKYIENPLAILMSLGILLLTSCSAPKLYVPNVLNAPLLSEKGDFESSLWINPSGDVNPSGDDLTAYELQGAYAVSDKMVALVNTSLLSYTDDNAYNKHGLFEGGLGYYASFWPTKSDWKLGRAEILTNYGFGWASEKRGDDRYSGQYHRFSVQPALGFVSKYFELSLGVRFGFTRFNEYKYFKGSTLIDSDKLKFSTIDPFLNFGVGGPRFKIIYQMSVNDAMSRRDEYLRVVGDDFVSNTYGFAAGFTLLISPSLKKPKQ